MTIGLKVKQLYLADGFTQESFANAEIIFVSPTFVSKVENGKKEYDEKQLKDIKKHFDLVDIPFSEKEYPAFRMRINSFRDYIREDRINDAKEMQAKISNITKLEFCEPDFSMLYRLHEILLLFVEGDIEKAEELLLPLQDKYDSFNDENKFHFNCRMGYLLIQQNKRDEAHECYQKSLTLEDSSEHISEEDKKYLYYAIANYYVGINCPHLVILFLTRLDRADIEKCATIQNLSINLALSMSYLQVNISGESERLLKICKLHSSIIEDKFYIGLVEFGFGVLYRCQKYEEQAIVHFENASEFFNETSDYYFLIFYCKSCCLITLNRTNEVEDEHKRLKSLQNKNELQEIILGTLEHMMIMTNNMTSFNKESVDYLEETSIPFFINMGDSLEAIRCYKLIKQYYFKNRKKTEVHKVNTKIVEIYDKINSNKDGW